MIPHVKILSASSHPHDVLNVEFIRTFQAQSFDGSAVLYRLELDLAGARPPALAIDTNLNKAMGAGSARSRLLWTVQTFSLLQEL